MRKFKNIICVALAVLMCLAFVACDESEDTKTPAGDENTENTENTDTHTHAFGEWSVTREATTSREGEETRSCSCGETEKRTIAKTFSSGFSYEVNADGTSCTITGIGTCTDIRINMPETIDGYTVTKIGNNAFYDCKSIRKIILPDTITEIGSTAFYACTGIDEIILPEGLETIGSAAFGICISLTSIRIPKNVKTIEGGAFAFCSSLVEVCNDSELEIVLGAEDNGALGYYAKNIYPSQKPASKLVEVDEFVFYNDNGKYLLVGYKGEDDHLVLPKTVNGQSYAVADLSFSYIKWLKSMVIPEGVTEIGFAVFFESEGIENITIPKSVTAIGENALAGCESLTDIYYAGSETEWQNIGYPNAYNELEGITIHYNYAD